MALTLCETKADRRGRELAAHGTALFPIACYYDDLAKEDVPWHWHDELEAVVVAEGTAAVVVDSKEYIVGQGEGFFINAGVLHAASIRASAACRFHSAVFHPRLIGGGIDSIFWQNYIHPLIENAALKIIHFGRSGRWHREAIQAIDVAWQECAMERPGYEFRVRSSLSQLVFLLSGHLSATTNRPSERELRDEKRIKAMLQYIQEHHNGELSTARIAESAMIGESECLRCFRNTIGVSPIQYVKQFRIQRAAELLTSTGQRIADISAHCGFQDTSYFAKTFRKIKGCTPTEYRERGGAST